MRHNAVMSHKKSVIIILSGVLSFIHIPLLFPREYTTSNLVSTSIAEPKQVPRFST